MMKILKRVFKLASLVIPLVGLAPLAHANPDLITLFRSVEALRKGPFDQNILQGSKGRVGVLNGFPAGGVLFQAAYRNTTAQQLADVYSFYTGNLFTTNYYQLMGEYVYGDALSDHPLDHRAIQNASAAALPKAAGMVRHWVLEKHYIHQFPNSGLAKAFRVRGISGSEFEQEYAKYFLNFFLGGLENDTQYLSAYLLAKGSPLAESASLDRARNLIAQKYDSAKSNWGEGNAVSRRLYQLRNAIHNQLSSTVIGQIDAFIRDFPQFKSDSTLMEIRSILVSYYSVSAKRVAEAAQRFGAPDIAATAENLQKSGASLSGCLQLANQVAALRTALTTSGAIKTEKKTDALIVLLTASQYLNKEMNVMGNVRSKDALKILINMVYVEGFLIKDNWQYFMSEIESASSVESAAAQMPDIIGIASDTLTQAFDPALNQWLSIEPQMQYFIDNTIKSSALNTAAIVVEKIK